MICVTFKIQSSFYSKALMGIYHYSCNIKLRIADGGGKMYIIPILVDVSSIMSTVKVGLRKS